MAFSARITDMIISSATSGAPLPIATPAAATVLIGGLPAAGVGSSCGVDVVLLGSFSVTLAGVPAARIGDPTGAGGSVIGPGALTVLIG